MMGNEDQILAVVIGLKGDVGKVLDRTEVAAQERRDLFALLHEVRENGCVKGRENERQIDALARANKGGGRGPAKAVQFLGWTFSGYRLADVTRAIVVLVMIVVCAMIMLRIYGLNEAVAMLSKRMTGMP